MKKILTAWLILIASTAAAQTSGPAFLDATLSRVRTQLEAQIERIKRAREVADARITLAGIRVEEQLQRAEEDLTVQNERLKLLQEQVLGQLKEADEAFLAFRNDWRPALIQAVRSIRSQISSTSGLITQLQRLQAQSATEGAGLLSRCQSTATANCSRMSGNGAEEDSGCPCGDQAFLTRLADIAPPSLAELEAELALLESQSGSSGGSQSAAALTAVAPAPSCPRCGN